MNLDVVRRKLEAILAVKDEVYAEEPVSREAADLAARAMGR